MPGTPVQIATAGRLRPSSAPVRYGLRERPGSRPDRDPDRPGGSPAIAAACVDVVGEPAAVIDPPRLERAVGQGAQGRAAADIGDLEPDALLGADTHHGDVAAGLDARVPERGYGDEPGDHAGRPVEIAAMRHAVEMRADDDFRRVAISTWQRHIGVGRSVLGDLEFKLSRMVEHGSRPWCLSRPVSVAGHPRPAGVRPPTAQKG